MLLINLPALSVRYPANVKSSTWSVVELIKLPLASYCASLVKILLGLWFNLITILIPTVSGKPLLNSINLFKSLAVIVPLPLASIDKSATLLAALYVLSKPFNPS